MNEIWKDIKGYEGFYQVSNYGRIKSLQRKDSINRHRTEKILRQRKSSNGYLNVSLMKYGEEKCVTVHRVVAQAFIENPYRLPCVNHKDENRQNNKVDNLEWCSYKYNSNYGRCKEKIANKLGKSVMAKCQDGSTELYKSISEASRSILGSTKGIGNIKVAIDKGGIAYKRRWEYATYILED